MSGDAKLRSLQRAAAAFIAQAERSTGGYSISGGHALPEYAALCDLLESQGVQLQMLADSREHLMKWDSAFRDAAEAEGGSDA